MTNPAQTVNVEGNVYTVKPLSSTAVKSYEVTTPNGQSKRLEEDANDGYFVMLDVPFGRSRRDGEGETIQEAVEAYHYEHAE